MTPPKDPRFANTLNNLARAFQSLEIAATTPVTEARDLAGIIKSFEIVYELSWKALKHYLADSGHETSTARDVFAQAFQSGIIDDQDLWLRMIADRNLTVHTYNEKFAREMVERIKSDYLSAYRAVQSKISA